MTPPKAMTGASNTQQVVKLPIETQSASKTTERTGLRRPTVNLLIGPRIGGGELRLGSVNEAGQKPSFGNILPDGYRTNAEGNPLFTDLFVDVMAGIGVNVPATSRVHLAINLLGSLGGGQIGATSGAVGNNPRLFRAGADLELLARFQTRTGKVGFEAGVNYAPRYLRGPSEERFYQLDSSDGTRAWDFSRGFVHTLAVRAGLTLLRGAVTVVGGVDLITQGAFWGASRETQFYKPKDPDLFFDARPGRHGYGMLLVDPIQIFKEVVYDESGARRKPTPATENLCKDEATGTLPVLANSSVQQVSERTQRTVGRLSLKVSTLLKDLEVLKSDDQAALGKLESQLQTARVAIRPAVEAYLKATGSYYTTVGGLRTINEENRKALNSEVEKKLVTYLPHAADIKKNPKVLIDGLNELAIVNANKKTDPIVGAIAPCASDELFSAIEENFPSEVKSTPDVQKKPDILAINLVGLANLNSNPVLFLEGKPGHRFTNAPYETDKDYIDAVNAGSGNVYNAVRAHAVKAGSEQQLDHIAAIVSGEHGGYFQKKEDYEKELPFYDYAVIHVTGLANRNSRGSSKPLGSLSPENKQLSLRRAHLVVKALEDKGSRVTLKAHGLDEEGNKNQLYNDTKVGANLKVNRGVYFWYEGIDLKKLAEDVSAIRKKPEGARSDKENRLLKAIAENQQVAEALTGK